MRDKDEFVECFKQTGVKCYELVSLVMKDGWYLATMHNRVTGHYKEQAFLYYTKKEVIHKLRNEYGCIIRKGAI